MATLQEIQAQIAELQKKAEQIVQAQRQPVIDRIKDEIKSYSITAKELGFKASRGSIKPISSEVKERTQVPPKYKLDEKTWTGRGRPPVWLVQYEASGGDRAKILVK